jgi:hypothetical protein
MPVDKTWQQKSDAAVLVVLQGIGTTVSIDGFLTLLGKPKITWASEPTADDLNMVSSYFKFGDNFEWV